MGNRNFFNDLERRNVYKAAVVSAVFVRVFGRDGS